MAKPQLEDGHIRIANELWQALCRTDLSGAEFRVLLAVIRMTWGFRKLSAEIKQPVLAELTGFSHRGYISRITNNLARRGILTKTTSHGKTTTYSINKDYETWLGPGSTHHQVSTASEVSTHSQCTVSTHPQVSTSTHSQVSTVLTPSASDTLLETNNLKDMSTNMRMLTRAFVDLYCAGAPRLPQIQKDAQRLSEEIPDFDELMAVTVLQVYHRNCFKPEEPIGRLIWFKQKIADYIASGKLPGTPSGNGHRGSSDLSRELMAQGLKPYVTQTATYYLDDSMQRKANTMAEWMLEQSLERYAKQHPERVIVRG